MTFLHLIIILGSINENRRNSDMEKNKKNQLDFSDRRASIESCFDTNNFAVHIISLLSPLEIYRRDSMDKGIL